MVLEMSKGPTGGEISDISEALLDHLVKIAYPVGMLLVYDFRIGPNPIQVRLWKYVVS